MRYSVYIDWVDEDGVDNYVQFYPDNIEPFKLVRESDQYFKRLGWGEVSIKNDPDSYALASNNIYRLFDILTLGTSIDIDPTTEIKIKYVIEDSVLSNNTILGYFGINDCVIRDNGIEKTLAVTPTIQDDYTALLESWETEIESFDDLEYSITEIDLNIESIGTVTIDDWSERPALILQNPPAPAPKINVKASLVTLNDFFDGEAPKFSLVAIEPTRFQDYEGFYLQDRIDILGEDMSSLTINGYISFNIYSTFDTTQTGQLVNTSNLVTYDGITYKSIQDNNLGNQPDISPLWWEAIYIGEIFPEKGDYELSEFTIWFEGDYLVFPLTLKESYRCTTKFSRDEFRKTDVTNPDYPASGAPFLPPTGTGWHMRNKIKVEGQDGHLWTRKPFNEAYKDSWVLQDAETNSGSESANFSWVHKRTTKIFYPDEDTSKTLTSTFTLRAFLEYVFQNTNTAFASKNVYSTFFFNDNEANLPILADRIGEGINYVIMAPNYLNNCRVFFTKELISGLDPLDTDNFPKITLRGIIEDLNKQFGNNLYFYMDSSLNLHIEHIKYIDYTYVAEDLIKLNGVNRIELDFTESWKYDKTRMFNRVELSTVNSSGVDFTDNLITFDKIVSNKRNIDIKNEIKTDIFSTDLRYAVENSSDLENGIMLISIKEELKPVLIGELLMVVSTWVVANKVGRVSGVSQSNGYMALSNLLYDFGRYEGVWTQGELNYASVPFVKTSRTKLGDEILLRGSFDSLFYITNLGIGLLDDGTIDFEQESTTLNLLYRYNSVPDTDGFRLMVQKTTDFEGAENIYFDFGNYET